MSTAILLRDATRAARRWQTYGLRTAFSGVLLGLVLAALWGMFELVHALDVSQYGQLARGMFVAFAVIQVVLGGSVAPAVVARAVIEEREQRTLDLLLLSKLTPRQILLAKIAGRLVVLLTLILGALPVLALVTSLGGVAPVQVIAVTVHAFTSVVVLGALGGFFGIFTRSPLLAAAASLLYGAIAFLCVPVLYVALSGDWRGVAYVSPLFGTVAEDWLSLLPLLTYAPIVALVVWLGSRLYELRASGATLRRYFEGGVWASGWATGVAVAVGLGLVTVLPVGIGLSWSGALISGSGSRIPAAVMALGGGVIVWGWVVALLVLLTWGYLRIGMDFVMMADDLLGVGGLRGAQTDKRVRVWGNPVAWRELRGQAWSVLSPTLGVWGLVLFYVFQSAVCFVPGGMVVVGGANALAAIVLAAWLITTSVERERTSGSLEILLGTTISPLSVAVGKLAGAAAPSAAALVVSLPLAVLGAPYLDLVLRGADVILSSTLLGLAAFAWVTALWALVLVVGMSLALRLKNPRNAFGLLLTGVAALLVVPPVAAAILDRLWWLALPFRLLTPILVPRPNWGEVLVSTAGWAGLAAVLLVLLVVRLRAWGLRHA